MIPLLFKSLVRPHLEYGNVVWGPHFKEDMKSVERVQRRATKLISCIKDYTYEERLRILELPSLMHRRRRGDMIYAYKIIKGEMDIKVSDFFSFSDLKTRGHDLKIFKRHANKHVRVNAFSNRVVNDWNKLPATVVEAASVNAFKCKLDEYWTDVAYKTPF